jgi:hypothetical protein
MAEIGGGFNGSPQHFISDDGMELNDEAATADILLGFPAGGDLGSMAARRVDELDWSRL